MREREQETEKKGFLPTWFSSIVLTNLTPASNFSDWWWSNGKQRKKKPPSKKNGKGSKKKTNENKDTTQESERFKKEP